MEPLSEAALTEVLETAFGDPMSASWLLSKEVLRMPAAREDLQRGVVVRFSTSVPRGMSTLSSGMFQKGMSKEVTYNETYIVPYFSVGHFVLCLAFDSALGALMDFDANVQCLPIRKVVIDLRPTRHLNIMFYNSQSSTHSILCVGKVVRGGQFLCHNLILNESAFLSAQRLPSTRDVEIMSYYAESTPCQFCMFREIECHCAPEVLERGKTFPKNELKSWEDWSRAFSCLRNHSTRSLVMTKSANDDQALQTTLVSRVSAIRGGCSRNVSDLECVDKLMRFFVRASGDVGICDTRIMLTNKSLPPNSSTLRISSITEDADCAEQLACDSRVLEGRAICAGRPAIKGTRPHADARKRTRDARDEREAESGEIKCEECSRTFPRKYDLRRHVMSKHAKQKPFQCSMCDASFTQKCHVAYHERLVHLRLEQFPCPVCGKNFSSVSNQRKHMRNRHPAELADHVDVEAPTQ